MTHHLHYPIRRLSVVALVALAGCTSPTGPAASSEPAAAPVAATPPAAPPATPAPSAAAAPAPASTAAAPVNLVASPPVKFEESIARAGQTACSAGR